MNRRTILVVDDQSINRRILGKMLSDQFDILYAEDGKHALEVMHQHDDISAVLLDIVMPVMDGYQVLAAMAKDPVLDKIPVIVSSQKDGDEDEVKALSLGAYDFIAKPYKADIIRHRLMNTIKLRETAAMVNKTERDELTGLYNKQFFLGSVREMLEKNPDKSHNMLCVGVERFKLVNDTYGDAVGDQVLRHIADTLLAICKTYRLCGRFSADEFYALIPDTPQNDEEIISGLCQQVNEYPIDMEIKLHCGIYRINGDEHSINAICDRAKLAADTNRGKYNQLFNYYDDSLRQKLLKEQYITSQMENALSERQFVIYYQPKYDLHTEMVAGAEALVRWIHPERGFMSPGEFIPLFEKNGFITKLDYYVWETACRDIRSWMDRGYPPVPVSVNVSRADIFNPKLFDMLTGLIAQYEIPIRYLHLEITESAYTDNPDQIVAVVERLHDHGFIIEMDDFGSGYSSLNMLAELPVDILKLDMRFVQSESTHTSGRGIISFVISLAKWMKLSVIAEGVETAEQIASLRSMDCNFVQGFYFAKPMPKEEFETLICTVAVRMLPEVTSATAHAHAKEQTEPVVKPQMLVVDDIEVNRAVLHEIFRGDYEVIEKEDGLQALEYINQNTEKIKVILLDLLMPVMDGFQLLGKIRADKKLAQLPVIVTSQGDVTAEERALDLGADDFISKPYSPQIVCHRVSNVVEIYQAQNRKDRKLVETKKREETLLESIPGGVAIYHLKKDGRLAAEYVSEGLARLCGYDTAGFLEKLREDARTQVALDDQPHLIDAIEKGVQSHGQIHEVVHLLGADQSRKLVRFDANIFTEGQMAEDELAILYAVHTRVPEESESVLIEQNRYRYILDNLDVAYFELDEDGTFYASDKYSLYRLSEQPVETILTNAGTHQSVYPEDLPLLFEFFNMKKKKLPSAAVTLRLQMKDDSYRFTEMMGFFEYDDQGRRTKTIGVLRDVDKEWMKQNRKLQDALKLATLANQSKTEFLARVSHEMRTPLNGILGITSLMEGKKAGEDISHDLEALQQSGSYLMNLIDDTLDVSTIEQGKMELHPTVCDGRTAFDNILSMVRPGMDAKRIQFRMRVGELPFTKLYIDIGRVEQAVMNILGNAVKFTPVDGSIVFEMENIAQKDGVITDRIVIRDTGIGMSREFLPHVFEPFSQEHGGNKSAFHGTGLGMTIARQCIELMGGTIKVASEQGKGTTVEIILPMQIATEEQLELWHEEKEKASLEILRGKRILLCEDHPLNAEISIRLLEKKGLLVEHAVNGRVGLEKFMKSTEDYYAAVLMDIRMPEMDGLEATRKIRRLKRKDALTVPIIAMTANTLQEDVRHTIDAGMSEHLGKPVNPDRLYQVLAEQLGKPGAQEKKAVLVVDDIEMNRGFIRAAIQNKYRVYEAANGEEALQVLAGHERIDAVVTDIQMPEMDGRELIRRIRAEQRFDSVAILANTIYGDHHQEDDLLADGADDFIYKPASPHVILMRLDHILRTVR